MKVLLINAPKTNRIGGGYVSPIVDANVPLALLQLAAVLEKYGHEVKIIDNIADRDSQILEKGEDYLRYGIPEEILLRRIKEFNPVLVGISGMFTAQLNDVLSMSKLVKKYKKNIPVVIGGGVANAEEVIKFLENEKSVDIIVYGEGEYTLLELVEGYSLGKTKLKDIKGIYYRDKTGKVIKNEKRQWEFHLDNIPFPAYHLIDMDYYLDLPKKKQIYYRTRDDYRTITLSTSRGCPERCHFCAVFLTMGRLWRGFSPEYVVEHIKLLVNKYNVEQIHIEDDNFSHHVERAREIMDLMIKDKVKVKWDPSSGLRADKIDEDLIVKMKKSGCTRVNVAPEVGNQEVLDKIIKKRMSLNAVVQVAKWCKKHKLPLQAFFVIGFPGETKRDIQMTVDFAKMLMRKYDVIVSGAMNATQFYGTEMYKEAKEKGYLIEEVTPDNISQGMPGFRGFFRTEEFGPEDLMEFNKKLVRAAYFYSAKRYLKQPGQLIKRFRNPFLIKVALERFLKGAYVSN